MRPLLSDELWERIVPLLPPEKEKPKGGRPRVPDRAALTGILFVLRSGIPWEMLPPEMGCGSGMTCWRRLQEWQRAGVWERLHQVLLEELGRGGDIDWSRAAVDSATVAAKKGRCDGSQPDGQGQTGLEASSSRRSTRHSADRALDGCQRSRFAGLGGVARWRAADSRASQPAAPPPGQAARRQRIRLSPVPPLLPKPRDQTAHRPTRDRAEGSSRSAPLGRRTDPRLACSVSSVADPR